MGNTQSNSKKAAKSPQGRYFYLTPAPRQWHPNGVLDTSRFDSLTRGRASSGVIPDTRVVTAERDMAEIRQRQEARRARRRREREQERARARRRGGGSNTSPRRETEPTLELGPEFDAPLTLDEILAGGLASAKQPIASRVVAPSVEQPEETDFPPYYLDPFAKESQQGTASFITQSQLETFGRPQRFLTREQHLQEARRIAEQSRREALAEENKTFGDRIKEGWEWFDGGKDRAALPFQVFATPLVKLQGRLNEISKLDPKDPATQGKSRQELYQEAYASYVRDTGGNTEYGATARAYMESLLPNASAAVGGRVASGIIAAAPIPAQAKLPVNIIVSSLASMGSGALANYGQEQSWKKLDPSGQLYKAMMAQRASDAENFPVGTTLGQTGSSVVFGRYGRGAPLTSRVMAGGLSAGTGMLMDVAQGNSIDPLRSLLDFGTGAILNKDSRLVGRPLNVVGAKVARGITRPLGLAPGGRNTARGRAQAAATRDAESRAWLAELGDVPQNRVTASHLRPTYEPRELPGKASVRWADIADLPDGGTLLMPESGPGSTKRVLAPAPSPEQQTGAFMRRIRAVARQNKGELTEEPTGHAALENVLDVFDKAGAFTSGREKAAARTLWQTRAASWAKETGRDQNEFYDGLQANLDGSTPKDALHQQATQSAIQEFVEKSLGEKDPDKLYLTSSYADAAKIGFVNLPSGARFYMFGGPFTHIKGVDLWAKDGFGWRVSKPGIANRIVSQGKGKHDIGNGKLDSAVLHVAIKNRLQNVFASHGNIAIKAEIMHALKSGMDKDKLLKHINETIDKYNGNGDELDDGAKKLTKLPNVSSIEEFIGTRNALGLLDTHFNDRVGIYDPSHPKWQIGTLDSKVKTFTKRERFARLFWKENENPFGTTWEDVAGLMTQPEVREMPTGAAMALIGIDKDGVPQFIPHALYSYQVPGRNFGLLKGQPIGVSFPQEMRDENRNRLVREGLGRLDKKLDRLLKKRADEVEIQTEEAQRGVPVNKLTKLLTKSEREFIDNFRREFEPSPEALRQADTYTATRYSKDNRSGKYTDAAGNEQTFANEGIFPLDAQRLYVDHLHQEGEAGVKAWYDLQNRTMGALTGKSDLSSFVHESWHDWTTSLKEDHTSLLEKHFGSRDSVEFQEGGARAFERYLRDGYAPHPELRQLFEVIKRAMVKIYHQVKGTPIEDSVHPDIRNLFDEVLGAGQANATSDPVPNDSALRRIAQPIATPPVATQRPAVRMRTPTTARPVTSEKSEKEKRPQPDVGAQLRHSLALHQSNPALAQRLKQTPAPRRARSKKR